MAKPVRFVSRAVTQDAPETVAGTILDLNNWNSFQGWGPLPGIKEAEFLEQPEGIVGTRFGVTNTDGSRHVEQIIEWDPSRIVRVRMSEFPKSLSRFATEYIETFRFTKRDDGTLVEREFELTPTGVLARPFLILIGMMLKKAIDRHNVHWGGVPV